MTSCVMADLCSSSFPSVFTVSERLRQTIRPGSLFSESNPGTV